jgi:hypothetical protein
MGPAVMANEGSGPPDRYPDCPVCGRDMALLGAGPHPAANPTHVRRLFHCPQCGHTEVRLVSRLISPPSKWR